MPVFTRLDGGILVVTVDGDYTSAELRKVGEAGIRQPETPRPARVLLDMSGAAGLAKRTTAELKDTAVFFAGLKSDLGRVAILAPDDLSYGLMRLGESWFATSGAGIAGRVFRTRPEAVAFLEEAQTDDDDGR